MPPFNERKNELNCFYVACYIWNGHFDNVMEKLVAAVGYSFSYERRYYLSIAIHMAVQVKGSQEL